MVTLSTEQQQQVDQLLKNTATRCLGVYLIDLPKQFTVFPTTEFYYDQIHKVTIKTQRQYLPPFKQMIARREQELKNTQPIDPIDGNFLKAIHPLPNTDTDKIQGIIFERMQSEGVPDVARVLEGYRWQDEVTLKIEMNARNGSDSRYDQDRNTSPDIYNNDVPEKLAQMYKLFDHIQVRDDFTIPSEPGFCFTNGFMRNGVEEYKDISFTYRYEGKEDFYISLQSSDFSEDLSLLESPEEYDPDGEGYTVYKGTRESNHLVMEEWIRKGDFFYNNDYSWRNDEGYIFKLGINLFNASYKKPQLWVQMNYIIPKNDNVPTYSEEQLMSIWREITNSIRIRESSFANE